jgi:multidrug efflux pump subunit AcrA (membrane-fusion protein)
MTTHPENSGNTPRKSGTVGKIIGALILIACVGGLGYLLYQQKAKAQESPAAEQTTQQRVAVVTTPAAARDFERSLVVQGNVEARHFAMVSPRVPGIIETISVDEGDAVIADQTILFRTDAVALEKNVQISRHALTVAQCAQREAGANLEKTRVDFRKAKLDYERFERLYQQQAVTADAFEQQQSGYEQLEAVVKLAEAQVDLAAAQTEQAQAALAIAEKDLADATIYAPIGGTVSVRLQEPGEMGDVGKPVIRIDDTSVVEVAAFLPAQYYASVAPNQTPMRIRVSGIDLESHVVTYKSPTIHPKLRAFEVKCLLKEPPEGVAPGAMAEIVVVLDSRQGLGVPVRAVQQRGGGSVVFVVEGNTVRQKTVKTGFESAGWIELLEADVKEGAAIVTMGQYMVEEGSSVSVQQEAK